jgi:hypothetical protein
MDAAAYDELPRAYRVGLRLRALGADDGLIADCLDMDPAGIPALVEIGKAKLDHIHQAGGRNQEAASEILPPVRSSQKKIGAPPLDETHEFR